MVPPSRTDSYTYAFVQIECSLHRKLRQVVNARLRVLNTLPGCQLQELASEYGADDKLGLAESYCAEADRALQSENNSDSDPFDLGYPFERLRTAIKQGNKPALDDILLERAGLWYAKQVLTEDQLAEQLKLSDMTRPEEWYPQARQLRRKLIMHVGPTNSGKTYNALQRLKQAGSGCFAGPLRLLAFEIYERFNAEGVKCNLTTGEERRVDDEVFLTSSTIEMLNLANEIDVLVIDEIQMIADPDRGSAWTQALLGCPAREIHMCGEESAVALVQRIAATIGEDVEVRRYKRLGELQAMEKSLESSFREVEEGDAIVTFSRANIFDVKRNIEQVTGRKCAVVYGGLPPETRAAQARLFNDPTSDYSVMVASDAIGMGLNLSIKRVVFETMEKWNGKENVRLPTPQIKQIAGRAGRFKARPKEDEIDPPKDVPGYVTTLRPADLDVLKAALAEPTQQLQYAMLKPPVEIVERFISSLPLAARLSTGVRHLQALSRTRNDMYLVRDMRSPALISTMDLLHDIRNLSFRERWTCIDAPLRGRDEAQVASFLELARHLADGSPAQILDIDAIDVELLDQEDLDFGARTSERLAKLETLHAQTVTYMWLSNRFPGTFSAIAEAYQLKQLCEQRIEATLESMKASKSAAKRDKPFISRDQFFSQIRRQRENHRGSRKKQRQQSRR
ncbi:RNA helicase [Savitreella phatthalungensis]